MRMVEFWDVVSDPNFDHKNPACYNAVFYKNPAREFVASNTEKFECQYYTHLLGEEDLSTLVPVPRLYQELTDL